MNPPIDSFCDDAFCTEVFVALASSQIKHQVAFYSALLKVAPNPDTANYAEFRFPGLRLAIFTPQSDNATEFSAASAPASGPMSLCLEVNSLERAIARLQTIGYPAPGEIMHTSHGQEIYAYDPDGNRLILHQSPRKI